MSSICELLKNIAPNSASNIQAWMSVGTLGVTILMAYYANEALNSWLSQKKFDYKINIKSNLPIFYNLLHSIYHFGDNYTINTLATRNNKPILVGPHVPNNNSFETIIDYFVHLEYSKNKFNQEFKLIQQKVLESVIGLENEELKNLYFDMADFISYNDRLLDDLYIFISFYNDAYRFSGKVDQIHIDSIIDKYKFEILNNNLDHQINAFKSRVDNYLRA